MGEETSCFTEKRSDSEIDISKGGEDAMVGLGAWAFMCEDKVKNSTQR